MIKIDNFRLTGINIDVTNAETVWVVTGYFLTEKGRLFANFVYTTDEVMVLRSGAKKFDPSRKMMSMSDAIMEEAHEIIARKIWQDFLEEDGKNSTEQKSKGD